VEDAKITKIGTTEEASEGSMASRRPAAGRLVEGPLFHPDPKVDLAVMRVAGIDVPPIPIACYDPKQTPVLTISRKPMRGPSCSLLA
jgi:hypothetical protein